MRARRLAVISAVGVTAVGGSGAAIATTQGEGRKAEDAVVADAAKRLQVKPGELRRALRSAHEAQLDRAVREGELTRKQADRMKRMQRESGNVLGPAPGPGHHRGFGGPPMRTRIVGGPLDDVARALGISRASLFERLHEGKSLAQIAKAEGKSLDDVKKALRERAEARLDRAVKSGDLTKKQRDAMLEHLGEHIDRLGEGRMGPPHGPPPFGGHHGPPMGPPPGP